MGRIKRADAAGAIYHMLNRGNRRATIFDLRRQLYFRFVLPHRKAQPDGTQTAWSCSSSDAGSGGTLALSQRATSTSVEECARIEAVMTSAVR